MDQERVSEPTQAGGVFGKVMADISARAKEYRERTPIGTRRQHTSMPDTTEIAPERLAELRGLPKRKWATTFDAFTVSSANAKACDAARSIAAGTWAPWCLVLSGAYGTGKTHLAYAVANYRRVHGLPYRMITAPTLMALLKDSIGIKEHTPDAYGPDDWVKSFGETTRLLIIDDFGAQQDTEWATVQLFAILNARYEAELPTMITTNLGNNRLDPRIASRCATGVVVCNGPDWRAK